MALSAQEQAEITSMHLKGNLGVERWLIPCIITIVLVLTGIVAMVLAHFIKQRRRLEDNKGEYEEALTDSDETLKKNQEIDETTLHENGSARPNGHHIVLSQLQ